MLAIVLAGTATQAPAAQASAAQASAAQAPLVLVRDGRAASVIVTADKPSAAARDAARDLQAWLERSGGAKIAIETEGRLGAAGGETRILVGDSKAVRALGVDASTFALEEICIRTFPGALVIVGDDERPDGVALKGTAWAVAAFAEDRLGVRVLWPGELGLVVPQRATIEIGREDTRYAPVLRKRTIRNGNYSDRIQTGLDRLGWSADEFKAHHKESEAWFRFHRIGGSSIGSYGHSYGDYWERFSKEHPEWFALQPDGTRDQSRAQGGVRSQLCVSNRALIEQVARDAAAALRANPTADCVSLSPNDGAAVTHCLCPACEAWDAPDGEMIEMWGPREPTRHVSLSDRYVRFYSEVAAIVAKEFPGRSLGAYAYGGYRLPPRREKLHPNVVLGFVGLSYLNESYRQESREAWRQWSETAGRIFLRPNALTSAMGSPAVHVHRLADDLRFCLERKMTACDFDCCYHHWASDGLNYYVLAKLLWDPSTDVDATIADYCRAGFGPAAATVGEYFRHCEANMEAYARLGEAKRGKDEVAPFARWTSDEFFVKCGALLDRAAAEAGGDEVVRQRVAFLRKAVELGEIRHRYWVARAAAKDGDREAATRAKAIEEERMKWYQSLGISWAINAANLEYYRGAF
jgi:peptidoglycan hydrolase-like protein with peptidoglycan-binding domain